MLKVSVFEQHAANIILPFSSCAPYAVQRQPCEVLKAVKVGFGDGIDVIRLTKVDAKTLQVLGTQQTIGKTSAY